MFSFKAVATLGLACITVCASAAQPTRFNYQVRLKDSSGQTLTGSHSLMFRIYEGGTATTTSSGTLKYEESKSLNVTDGIVSHAIGTGTPNGASLTPSTFATSNDLYLQVAVDGAIVMPRTRLESVPFAIKSANGDLRIAIDPSTPGFTTPYTISQPGSYYLAGNLTVSSGNAINITTGSVTLDLNGYTISSTKTPATNLGVFIYTNLVNQTIQNVTIRNGKISGGVTGGPFGYTGPGFGSGITGAGSVSQVSISDISISGVAYSGISFPFPPVGVTVERCSVRSAGDSGIAGTVVRNCEVSDIGGVDIVRTGIFGADLVDSCKAESLGTAISTTVASNCVGISTGPDNYYGIYARIISNCYGKTSGTGAGIYATNSAMNCRGEATSGIGLYTTFMATNCVGISSGNHGLQCDRNATNCQGTTSNASSYGLWVKGTANNCNGANSNLGSTIAIKSTIGIGCTTDGGITDIAAKFLGTP